MNEILEEYVKERTEDVRKESLMAGREVGREEGREVGRKEAILFAAEKIAARFSISLEEAREMLTT